MRSNLSARRRSARGIRARATLKLRRGLPSVRFVNELVNNSSIQDHAKAMKINEYPYTLHNLVATAARTDRDSPVWREGGKPV